jgi:hypothetical protein
MISKMWHIKKRSFIRVLDDFAQRSPVMEVRGVMDGGDELRAIVRFDTVTLVKNPRGDVSSKGPVTVGIRYHERFMAEPPHPAQIVTVFAPLMCFHPNIAFSGAICLGHPPANVSMAEILHMTWAALVFNMRVVNTVDWQGFNPEAAAYVRAHSSRFPLTQRGLLEPLAAAGQEVQS